MGILQLRSSRFFGVICIASAMPVLALGSTSAGLVAMMEAVGEAAQRAQPKQMPHYSEAPFAPYLGERPLRTGQRGHWWTPELKADLRQSEMKRALRRGQMPRWMLASMNPFAQTGGGGEGGGGEGPGEGGGGSGTSGGSTGGTAGQGGTNAGSTGGSTGGTAGQGGMGGFTNSNTGNNLKTLPIVGWSSRGQSGVSLAFYHSSIGDYVGDMGIGWSHSYDVHIDHAPASSAIVRMPDGLTVPYTENLGSFEAPPGWSADLVQNTGGDWTMTFKSHSKWEFDSDGYLTAVKDKSGNTTTITRDTSHRVTKVASQDGRDIDFTYNTNGLLDTVTDPDNRVWTCIYDTNDDMTELEYPSLSGTVHSREFAYDTAHNITTHTDLRGNDWTWTYDSSDRMTSWSNPLSQTTNWSYGTGSTTITLPGSQTITHNYANDQLTSEVDPASYSRSYTYDSDWNVTTVTDERGKVWTYTYDSDFNLLTAKNPLNKTTTYAYDTNGNLTSITDPLSNVTTIAYDTSHRVTSITDPLSRTAVTLTYNSYGEVLTRKDALNRTTSFSWTSQGDVEDVTLPGSIVYELTHDVLGRTTGLDDPALNTYTLSYDDWSRVTGQTNPDSTSTSVVYDLEGNVTSADDELSRTSSAVYDAAHRVSSTTNPKSETHTFARNSNGWVTSITNARSKTRTFTHTARGEVASLTLPDSSVEQWTYLGTGQASAYTNPLSQTIDYDYDDAGQLTDIDYPTGTDTGFSYDNAGRVTTMTDATGTTTWAYNAANELTSLTQPQGTLTYAYNTAGQRTSMTETGTGATTYAYDTAGRLSSLTNPFSETTSFTYDSSGRVSRKTFSAGHYEDHAYDSRSRLTSVTVKDSSNATLDTKSYTYDNASQVTAATEGGVATTYGYDNAGQLTSEAKASLSYTASYTYDANGNRLTRTVNGTTETYAYDNADKLTSVSVGGVATKTYGYDTAGRTTSIVTSAGTTTLAYDYEGRVTSLTAPGGFTQTNSYNGLDTRVSATVNSVTNTFHRDGAYVTNAVVSDSNATYTPGVSERRGTTTTYQHHGLKNGLDQSQAATALSATRVYDAFGNIASSTGTWQGPFGYAGAFGYQEDASGLKLLGHRYYDSDTGRFLTRDPIKDGRNWYTYCANSPVINTDPSGLVKVIVDIYPVAGIGNHIGIIICDDKGKPIHSFAGGPERGDIFDQGNLVSKSGPWKIGTQDFNEMRDHFGGYQGGGVIVVNDVTQDPQDWIDIFNGHEANMAKTVVPYEAIPLNPFAGNSNSWARELLQRADLIDAFNAGTKKTFRDSKGRPKGSKWSSLMWKPGYTADPWWMKNND